MLNALDLFSGIGGNTLALKGYINTIAYCESDRHAQAVLLSRMLDGQLPNRPICTDIVKLDGRELAGKIDIIIGGFPCQDISYAGRGVGLEGKRSGLFFEVMRLAREIVPTFVFLENVPGIRTRGLARVIEEFTGAGYDCRWFMLSAKEIGAPHIRNRWFMLCKNMANTDKQYVEPIIGCVEEPSKSSSKQKWGNVSNYSGSIYARQWWEAEPQLDRVVDGVPYRVERIKRLGNAVVPLQAKTAFETLMGIKFQ